MAWCCSVVSGCVNMLENWPCENAGCTLGSRRCENAACAGGAGARRSQKARVRRALMQRDLTLQLVFHPEALAFDDDGVGMMQQPIQDCGGQSAVMVEDRGPLLKGTVRG